MRVNVVKPANNSGLPSAKYGYLYVGHADDVITFPAVDESGVVTIGDIVMKEESKFTLLYLTPSKQKLNTDTSGELESRGFIQKIAGSYPGDEIQMNVFVKDLLNEPLIVISENCGKPFRKILGTPWNPMYFTTSFKDDVSDKLWELSFEKAFPDETPALFYDGNLEIEMEGEPVIVTGEPTEVVYVGGTGGFIDIKDEY
ncbi:hypothetical protein [Chryseobacterium sp. MP_3.2]|uniref:hypothetical protein n=1 Tax=Chryseobacterium sp. MP_3.2 TaxID=3071712 RepID=UPI002DF736E6|nr:hypothetical protein [Chryseobacterium sp. MP_3.2]